MLFRFLKGIFCRSAPDEPREIPDKIGLFEVTELQGKPREIEPPARVKPLHSFDDTVAVNAS